MKSYWRIAILSLLLLAVIVPTSMTQAKGGSEPPYDLKGSIAGAHYVIRVPALWNGTLLLYAHGYTMEPEKQPEASFSAAYSEGELPLEELLLSKGYALAASGFRGTGWNVEEGLQDTEELLELFEKHIGHPDRVILYGISMGGVIALKSIESDKGLYDGIIPMCTSGAGTTAAFDRKLDYALAYDVVFGWPDDWGTIGDVRDDIEFYEDVWFAKAMPEVFDGDNFAKWEFVRRVTGTALGGYYEYVGPVAMPPAVVAMTYFMTEQRAELEVRAGGAITQNMDRDYRLTQADRAALHVLGFSKTALDTFLGDMNAQKTTYEAEARAYVARYADFTGEIQVPVLMAHNVEDSISPVENTTAYLQTLKRAGTDDWLVRTYTDLPGHCNFTTGQMLKLVEEMEGWLEFERPPTDDAFPTSLNFVPGFEPGP